MRLELGIMAGENTKKFLMDLSTLVERFEKAANTLGAAPSQSEEAEEINEKPARRGRPPKQQAKSFEEDDTLSDDAPEQEETNNADATDNADDDVDFAPKKSKAKKSVQPSFDDGDDVSESEEVETPVKKASKSKKISVDDVNDACMERAGRTNRSEVLGILKKHFGIKSVTDLDESDYAECIKLMNGKR